MSRSKNGSLDEKSLRQHYAQAMDDVRVPAQLARRTVARCNEALGKRKNKGCKCRPSETRESRARAAFPSLVTRRGLIAALGTAACAGALGVGLFDRFSREAPPNNTEATPFGLSVATAAEAGKPVELSLTEEGFAPLNDAIGVAHHFRMNFACTGDGLEHVTFRMTGAPKGAATSDDEPSPLACLSEADYSPVDIAWARDAERALAYARELQEYGVIPSYRIAADGTAECLYASPVSSIAFDLTTLTDAGKGGWEDGFGGYRLVSGLVSDEAWASLDPVLGAARSYAERYAEFQAGQQQTADAASDDGMADTGSASADGMAGAGSTSANSRDHDTQARLGELLAAFEDATRVAWDSDDALLAWGRKLYVGSMRLAADSIARATLELEASFSDGQSRVRRYRIAPVNEFDARCGERFDALSSLPGAFDPQLARMSDPLTYRWLRGFLGVGQGGAIEEGGSSSADGSSSSSSRDGAASDPRLGAPLFTITDVTE